MKKQLLRSRSHRSSWWMRSFLLTFIVLWGGLNLAAQQDYTIITTFNSEEGDVKLSVSDPEHVKANTEITVTVTPKEGFELSSLKAGDEDITDHRTFVVVGNTEVVATFRKKTYRLAYFVDGQGSIAFTGVRNPDAVPHGSQVRVYTAAGAGYVLTGLTANGKDIMQEKRFVITEDTDILGIFSPKTFAVELPKVEHAKLSIEGYENLEQVPYNTELELVVEAEEGYEVETVRVDGKALEWPYTFVLKGSPQIEVVIKNVASVDKLQAQQLRIYRNTAAQLVVEAAPVGEWVRIYSLQGALQASHQVKSAKESIGLGQLVSGVYVVQVGDTSYRLVVAE